MSAKTVCRPTENAAMHGKYGKPLPPRAVLLVGFASARAVNDRYGLRLFANALIRKNQRGQR